MVAVIVVVLVVAGEKKKEEEGVAVLVVVAMLPLVAAALVAVRGDMLVLRLDMASKTLLRFSQHDSAAVELRMCCYIS